VMPKRMSDNWEWEFWKRVWAEQRLRRGELGPFTQIVSEISRTLVAPSRASCM
jgi:hypothetical protein